MCQWLETLALRDGDILLQDYHQMRLSRTLKAFGSEVRINLSEVFDLYDLPRVGYYKLRMVYDLQRILEVTWELYEPKCWDSFELIEVLELSYDFKSTDRKVFTELKQLTTCQEVIITKAGMLTDTTYSNLVFERQGNWFTPSTCLLAGVQRQYLLDKGQIKEASITRSNLTSFQNFKMINAMMPFDSSFTYSVELIEAYGKSLFSPF